MSHWNPNEQEQKGARSRAAGEEGKGAEGGKAAGGGKHGKREGAKKEGEGMKKDGLEVMHPQVEDLQMPEEALSNVQAELARTCQGAITKAFPMLQDQCPKILVEPGKDASGKRGAGKKPDYQCNNALGLPKLLQQLGGAKMTPQEVADKVIAELNCPIVDKAWSVSQGYINITISPAYVQSAIRLLYISGVQPPTVQKQKVLIDFSSPNIAKKMHVGHLRSTIIGDSLARTFEFAGHAVSRVNHVGDWGTQFGMLISHLKDKCPDFLEKAPDITDLVGFYKEAKARFDADPAFKLRSKEEVVKLQAGDEMNLKGWKLLCDISRQEFQVIYDLLGIKLEEVGESFYNPIMPRTLEVLERQGMITMSGGAKTIMPFETKKVKDLSMKDAQNIVQWFFVKDYAFDKATGTKNKTLEQPFLDLCVEGGTARMGVDGVHEIKTGKAFVQLIGADLADVDLFFKQCSKLLKPLHPKLVDAMSAGGHMKDDMIEVPRYSFPLIVQKADGGFTYDSTDVTASWYRTQKLGMDRIIYVVDLGQSEHFTMIFQNALDAGWRGRADGSKVRMDHVGFGLVLGPDGKKFKTRSGDTANLKDLLDCGVAHSMEVNREKEEARREKAAELGDERREEYVGFTAEQMQRNAEVIGLGAVKYCDLKQDRRKDYTFDEKKMLSLEGNTSAVVQYAYARICSMMRKAGADVAALREGARGADLRFLECERLLCDQLLRFPAVIEQTLDDLKPNNICDFLYKLVGRFNDCYATKEWKVVGSEWEASRLLLCDAVARHLRKAMELLGIEVLDRM